MRPRHRLQDPAAPDVAPQVYCTALFQRLEILNGRRADPRNTVRSERHDPRRSTRTALRTTPPVKTIQRIPAHLTQPRRRRVVQRPAGVLARRTDPVGHPHDRPAAMRTPPVPVTSPRATPMREPQRADPPTQQHRPHHRPWNGTHHKPDDHRQDREPAEVARVLKQPHHLGAPTRPARHAGLGIDTRAPPETPGRHNDHIRSDMPDTAQILLHATHTRTRCTRTSPAAHARSGTARRTPDNGAPLDPRSRSRPPHPDPETANTASTASDETGAQPAPPSAGPTARARSAHQHPFPHPHSDETPETPSTRS